MSDASMTERTDAAAASEMRDHLAGMWAAVAPRWGEHAEYTESRARPVTELMLEGAALEPGDRVLELACGAGGLGIAAAQRVAPDGEVVLSDVVAEMTTIAAGRAAEQGCDNVTARIHDVQAIDEPDESFDAVLCREGLMFATDPGEALREIRRVARPGAHVALAVWGPRARNPWLGLVLDAVGEELGRPVPPPGMPGPFALEDAAHLAELMTGADLADVDIHEHPVPMRADSLDAWWDRVSALAGPLAMILASLPQDRIASIRERLGAAAEPYVDGDGGVELPGVVLLAFGRR